jgi:hypothetical protein
LAAYGTLVSATSDRILARTARIESAAKAVSERESYAYGSGRPRSFLSALPSSTESAYASAPVSTVSASRRRFRMIRSESSFDVCINESTVAESTRPSCATAVRI